MKKGALCIDSSTIDLETVKAMAKIAKEEHNSGFLDAPVSGFCRTQLFVSFCWTWSDTHLMFQGAWEVLRLERSPSWSALRSLHPYHHF